MVWRHTRSDSEADTVQMERNWCNCREGLTVTLEGLVWHQPNRYDYNRTVLQAQSEDVLQSDTGLCKFYGIGARKSLYKQ